MKPEHLVVGQKYRYTCGSFAMTFLQFDPKRPVRKWQFSNGDIQDWYAENFLNYLIPEPPKDPAYGSVMLSPNHEILTYYKVETDGLPDANETVLGWHPEWEIPAGCYHDGESWMSEEGATLSEERAEMMLDTGLLPPTRWARWPVGPCEE